MTSAPHHPRICVTRRSGWWAAFVFVQLGCGADDGHVEYLAQTRFFDVLVHDDAVLPCAGEYEALDRLVLVLRDEFGIPLPSKRIDLHLWAFGAEGFPCVERAAGCFLHPPGEIHARRTSAIHHEVAHAAFWTLGFDAFYAEGLAETHASWILPTPNPGVDPRPLFGAGNTDFDYAHTAVFANFMIERFGPEVTLQAFRAASKEGAEQGFLRETGSTVDEIAEAFLAEPMLCSSQLVRCADEGETIAASWTFESALACTDPESLGSSAGTYTNRTVEIANDGMFHVEVQNGLVIMERCAPCAERDFWYFATDTEPSEVFLEAGRYALSIEPMPGFALHATIESLE